MKEQFLSESNEWYTPPKYITLVNAVLGEIELDPASCAVANKTVGAKRFIDASTNALDLPWNAQTLFLNPPYGKTANRSTAGIWAQKLINEFENDRVLEAILLVNACTSESWFKPLFDYPICFTNHRIRFLAPPERIKKDQPTKGNAFIYFGNHFGRFFSVFKDVGAVITKTKTY